MLAITPSILHVVPQLIHPTIQKLVIIGLNPLPKTPRAKSTFNSVFPLILKGLWLSAFLFNTVLEILLSEEGMKDMQIGNEGKLFSGHMMLYVENYKESKNNKQDYRTQYVKLTELYFIYYQ